MTARVVIIGGGHNGLTAAAFLARAGRQVTVVESRSVMGGLAARETFGGSYTVPGLLHDTTGVRPAFARELDLARFGLEWRPPPAVWAPSGDGVGLWLRRDASGEWIAHGDLADGDAARFATFRGFIARIARVVARLMETPPVDPRGRLWPLFLTGLDLRRLGARDMTELLRIGPMCVADWMRDSFRGERLSAAVALPGIEGTFSGPWSPGSAAGLLLRECLAGDEVVGGPARLTDALAEAARSSGATLRTDARVERIRLGDDGAAIGVRLHGGEVLDADVVVSSCDPRTTFLDLVGARYLPARLAAEVARIRARGTTAKVHLAITGELHTDDGEPVEALRTGDTLDDLERAFDPIKYGELPERPVLDVRVPSVSEPGLCPEGHHVISILAHFAPREPRGGWTDERRRALGDAVVAALDRHVAIAGRVVAREVLSPADIEARYGVAGGHIYHGEHAPDQLLFMRPTIQCSRYATPVPGLFLCGSGSHPGGGITCAPGALAARAILARS